MGLFYTAPEPTRGDSRETSVAAETVVYAWNDADSFRTRRDRDAECVEGVGCGSALSPFFAFKMTDFGEI